MTVSSERRGSGPRIPGPWNRSLQARLVAYFLLLSGMTVAIVGTVVYVSATQDLTRSVFERLEAVAEVKADALDRWIDEQRRNVVFVGSIPGVGDAARDLLADEEAAPGARGQLEQVLGTVVRQTSDAQEFLILDLDGVVRLSTRPEHEGAFQADQDFFINGLSNTSVQNVYASALTGRPTITVSTPLFDQDGRGRRVGVLAANLDLERVDRVVLERTGLGQAGATYLVGPDGDFLHARLDRGDVEGGVSSEAIDQALAGQRGQALYADYRGVPVIGVYRWLDEHEAALIVELPQSEAFAPVQSLALTIGLVGLFSAILLAAGIWLIARQVTRPILAVAASATAVAAGDLSQHVPVGSEDEVGRLTTAFNDMTDQLRESVETLERRVAERTAELTAALEAQREAEEQYRRLVEELPMVVYTDKPDATSTSTYISPRVEETFGYPREAWMHEDFFASVVHPEDRDRIQAEMEADLKSPDDRASHEYRIVAADGRIVWVQDEQWIVRDAGGQALHIQGFMMDVTERTLAQAELRRQKTYFESLVEASPVAVVTTVGAGDTVTSWNPGATRLFGWLPEEALGQPIDDLVVLDEALREEGRSITREALETGRSNRITRRSRKDGSLVDVEVHVVPLAVADEEMASLAIYHDISELVAARHEADAANQAKSTFLAAMSHEIRTPMNAIIGMSGLLADTELSEDQRDYVETIRTSGDALLTIINDILDFSKIEAGRVELEHEAFALRACFEGALDLLAPVAEQKGVELLYRVEGTLPRVVGDQGRLRQIVLNLLSNAIKFTAEGEVELHVAVTPDEGRDGCWQLLAEVRDTGIGIEPEAMGRLFRSFSQADASISRRFGGTGLGLAISQRLAELMGGSLTARSSGVPGEGSTFTLLARLAVAPEPSAAPAPDGPGVTDALEGRRVLIVDDNAANRRILLAQIERWGMHGTAVGSTREAEARITGSERLDVVLSDLHMPDGDGLELAAASFVARPDLPVVILSSVGWRGRATPAVRAYLTKPVKPSALYDTIVTLFSGVSTGPPPVAASAQPEAPTIEASLAERHPLRILLAEDNLVNQKLALKLLEREGYTADVVADGEAVLAALEEVHYDVVLMDVQMPQLDGLEATRRIRSALGTEGPHIVAMTANAMAEDREACLAAGMDDYISKPIRVEALVAALGRVPPPEPDA